jgi:hypothetical protein
MKPEDFTVGTRVRAIKRLGGCYPGSVYDIAAGVTGEVIAQYPDAATDEGDPIAHVRLDQPEPDLADWDNILHIFPDGDAAPEDFVVLSKPIVGFG